MAVPPNVPTSFVPRSSASGRSFSRIDLGGAYAFFGYGVLFVAIVIGLGVFGYGRYIESVKTAQNEKLEAAQKSINQVEVESFISLNDRLSSGRQLLEGHIALSNFFNQLEALTPATVSLDSLSVTMSDARVAKLSAHGTAQTFNSLAVLSGLLGKDNKIEDAIFSGIAVGKNGTVSFNVTATIDPTLTAFAPEGVRAASMSATASSTPTTP